MEKVRSFMGLVGYYRRLIHIFSNIGHPIVALRKKKKKFQWTSKCEAIFEQLKYMLTHAPILRIVDLEKYFVVCINACKK